MSNQLNNFIANAKIIGDEITEAFAGLNKEQLNWEPVPGSWGVGQCLDHLIVSNNLYLANIEKVVDGTHRPNIWSRIPILPKVVGQQLKKAVSPDSPKKVKTFPVFEPTINEVDDDIVAKFSENQAQLVAAMEATKDMDVGRIKIVTPVADMITIRLIDAFEVLVLHERRHFDQAKRVTDSARFPG